MDKEERQVMRGKFEECYGAVDEQLDEDTWLAWFGIWASAWKEAKGEGMMTKDTQSLWPDPIITPQELLEATIEKLEVDAMNRKPIDAIKEMNGLLTKYRLLKIGGRDDG